METPVFGLFLAKELVEKVHITTFNKAKTPSAQFLSVPLFFSACSVCRVHPPNNCHLDKLEVI
jgi:hypothetical protein